jgi:hypothetical protein
MQRISALCRQQRSGTSKAKIIQAENIYILTKYDKKICRNFALQYNC